MKKQIIERIARELLNEARRFRAIIRTAQPQVRVEAKSNDAELAFEVDFKVRPGFSVLPTDSDILDEIGTAIKENSSVGITSKYADGNYYYVISRDKTDKQRTYLYNVYIFKKSRVWQNYPDFIDRASNISSTINEPVTNSNEPIIGKKDNPKNIKSVKVSTEPGSVVRIGKSILLDSEKWLKSSQNNIKTYKPQPKAFAFINKVVNNQVDIVPATETPAGKPTDKLTDTPVASTPNTETPATVSDPKVIDAEKNVTNTLPTAVTPGSEETPVDNKRSVVPIKKGTQPEPQLVQQPKLKKQYTIKTEAVEFVNLTGNKMIPNGNKIKPGTVINVVKKSGDYIQVSFPGKPVTTLPQNSIVRVKPDIAKLKKIKVWNGSQPIIKQVDQLASKSNMNGYQLIDKLPAPVKFFRVENKKALIQSDGVQAWVLADILESDKDPVWIRVTDIK